MDRQRPGRQKSRSQMKLEMKLARDTKPSCKWARPPDAVATGTGNLDSVQN
jgi:hypothetical protein